MVIKRRNFKRALGERRYKILFVIACEGAITEPQYFSIFDQNNSLLKVFCIKSKNRSSPLQILKSMKKYLKEAALHPFDEAWIIIDKDNWTEEQLKKLFEWSEANENYGLAISNPLFEYWLLLHFEDGYGVSSGKECIARLRKYLPEYRKSIDPKIFTKEMIQKAVLRAGKNDSPSCERWPLKTGTTIYKLIKRINAHATIL